METLQLFHQDERHELWDIVMRLEVVYREVIILYFYDQIQIFAACTQIREASGANGETQFLPVPEATTFFYSVTADK